MRQHVLASPLKSVGGCIRALDGPGINVVLDLAKVEREETPPW